MEKWAQLKAGHSYANCLIFWRWQLTWNSSLKSSPLSSPWKNLQQDSFHLTLAITSVNFYTRAPHPWLSLWWREMGPSRVQFIFLISDGYFRRETLTAVSTCLSLSALKRYLMSNFGILHAPSKEIHLLWLQRGVCFFYLGSRHWLYVENLRFSPAGNMLWLWFKLLSHLCLKSQSCCCMKVGLIEENLLELHGGYCSSVPTVSPFLF